MTDPAALPPVRLEDLSTLEVSSAELSLKVAPLLAGRVTQLTYRGVDIYVGPDVNPNNWGATYWTSPQSDWGWPPVVEVDSAPYAAMPASNRPIALCSPVARIGSREFVVEKEFAPGPHPGSIDAFYTIRNVGNDTFDMANWEIARVPGGGLTFFPTGDHELTPIAPHQAMPTEKAFGCTFYDHSQFTVGACQKLHADGRHGVLVHVQQSSLGVLCIFKLFLDTAGKAQAPGEGECEIFANDDGKYVEIEVQGPYAKIAPGQRSTFCVRTVVVPLPNAAFLTQRADLVRWALAEAKRYGAPDLIAEESK